jgi:hypothetical protein
LRCWYCVGDKGCTGRETKHAHSHKLPHIHTVKLDSACVSGPVTPITFQRRTAMSAITKGIIIHPLTQGDDAHS